MKKACMAMSLISVMMAYGGLAETLSEPVMIRLSPDHNRCWETVYTNEVPLVWGWDWLTNTAASVELRIDGMNGDVVAHATAPATSWVWRPFEGGVPSAEDVYLLTLTYLDAGNLPLGSLTSRLAVVKGAFGQASVDPLVDSIEWSRVRGNVVIPYSADWAEETKSAVSGQVVIAKIGGVVRTNALTTPNGYFGWQITPSDWGTGTFDITLSFPGVATNVWQATLTRIMGGTVLVVQ